MADCIHGQEHPCKRCLASPHEVACNLNFRDRIHDGCNCRVLIDYAEQLEREGRPIPESARRLRAALSVRDDGGKE